MTKKRGCLIILLVAVLLLSSLWGVMKLYDWYKYAPSVNPHPKYFLTVQGHVDPALKDMIQIKWTIGYTTNNPECNTGKWLNLFGQNPREYYDRYLILINPDGSYKIKIPLDKFQSGFCKWDLLGGYYNYAYNNHWDSISLGRTAYFDDDKDSKKILNQTQLCQENKCTLAPNNEVLAYYTITLQQPIINLSFLKGS